MHTTPTLSPQHLLTHLITDMAQAVAVRAGESHQQQVARAEYAAQTILAFQPTDTTEAMLAGHCVMWHELIVDTVHTTLLGEPDATRRATRHGIVAMDKAFGDNLIRLQRHRARLAEAAADPPPAPPVAEPEIADRVHRHQSTTVSPDPGNASTLTPDHSPPAPEPLAGLNRQARRAMLSRCGWCR